MKVTHRTFNCCDSAGSRRAWWRRDELCCSVLQRIAAQMKLHRDVVVQSDRWAGFRRRCLGLLEWWQWQHFTGSQVRAEQSLCSRQRSAAARGHWEKKITLQLALHFISFSTLGPALLWLQLHVNLQHVSPTSSGTPWWADEAEPESQVEKFNTPRRELCDQVAFDFLFHPDKLFEMCSRKSGCCLRTSCQTQR